MHLTVHTDVLVVGGSLGGVAAALSAARLGASVLLAAPGDWIGGQLTAQGVCTPDENAWIEQGGGTATYLLLRERIREHYRRYALSDAGRRQEYFNPGSCWVSRLSVEPRVALAILRSMVGECPGITLLSGARPAAATVRDDRIVRVDLADRQARVVSVEAAMVLDATDLGDVLPLAGAEFRVGAESVEETGEPDAPAMPRPDRIQPFTFPFALELRPVGESHVIPRPPEYERMKELQRYHVLDGAMRGMFTEYSWWDYRRVIAAKNFDDLAFPCDVAMINTGSNDFRGGVLPAPDGAHGEILRTGRLASLGYVYWLQTECPREDDPGRKGYPELKLRSDWFGTDDGLAPEPYIRESRRVCALETVLEQDIVARDGSGREQQSGARARFRPDSVGIGHYWLDIHEGASDEPGLFLETRPYQIPLGALIPVRLRNLLPACKNLGVTHLTNGAFRLHPVEWNVGESAGLLAAFSLAESREPRDVYENPDLRERFQNELMDAGVPLYWWGDLPPGGPVWRAAQWLAMHRIWPEENEICFHPERQIEPEFPLQRAGCRTRGELAVRVFTELTAA